MAGRNGFSFKKKFLKIFFLKIFFSYMYGIGILFIFYCYLFKVSHPTWLTNLIFKKCLILKENNNKISEKIKNDGAGSLYLRLGTLCKIIFFILY